MTAPVSRRLYRD